MILGGEVDDDCKVAKDVEIEEDGEVVRGVNIEEDDEVGDRKSVV